MFNSYYSTVFSSEGNILHIKGENTGDPFTTDIKTIRRRIKATGKNKSVGPDLFSGEILKLGGKDMIPYLARLLDITMNNGTLPGDWKRATVIPIHKGGDRSVVTNYRPVSLTSVVCKQMKHVIASFLRKVWEKNDWLYEVNMDSDRDIRAKVKALRYARTLRTLWITETRLTLL